MSASVSRGPRRNVWHTWTTMAVPITSNFSKHEGSLAYVLLSLRQGCRELRSEEARRRRGPSTARTRAGNSGWSRQGAPPPLVTDLRPWTNRSNARMLKAERVDVESRLRHRWRRPEDLNEGRVPRGTFNHALRITPERAIRGMTHRSTARIAARSVRPQRSLRHT